MIEDDKQEVNPSHYHHHSELSNFRTYSQVFWPLHFELFHNCDDIMITASKLHYESIPDRPCSILSLLYIPGNILCFCQHSGCLMIIHRVHTRKQFVAWGSLATKLIILPRSPKVQMSTIAQCADVLVCNLLQLGVVRASAPHHGGFWQITISCLH